MTESIESCSAEHGGERASNKKTPKGQNMKKKEKEIEEDTVTGTLMPNDWDDDDNIIGLEISTEDDAFLVETNGLWEELKDLVESSDADVEVTGYIAEEKDGTKWITITGYDVLSESTDDDDNLNIYEADESDFENEEDELPC